MGQAVWQGIGHQSRHRSAVSGARRPGMRRAMWALAGRALVFTVVFGALLAWGGREVSFTGEANVDKTAQTARMFDQLISEQVHDLGCDTTPRLSLKVAVRPAQASPSQRAHGHWVFDTAVVTVVPFDQAVAQAKAGQVWVVGWCK